VNNLGLNRYQKTALVTIGWLFFAIFIGGLVRASGSGLGCPDWPKCFGSWLPPVSVTALPSNFDPSQFNAVKMWIEYINRFVGMISGLLIVAVGVLSFRYRKRKPSVFWCSAAAIVMVAFEGWQGGDVVLSGLNEWTISMHFWLAIGILFALIYAVYKTAEQHLNIFFESDGIHRTVLGISIVLLGLTIFQMILGTQIRSSVDAIIQADLPSGVWISQAGPMFVVHRSFSWTIFLAGVALMFLTWRKTDSLLLKKVAVGVMTAIILQILLGAGLYYLAVPSTLVILHTLGSAILISAEFTLLLAVGFSFKKAHSSEYNVNSETILKSINHFKSIKFRMIWIIHL
jgi:cytochrome c oxidase assembly protein subunit 15